MICELILGVPLEVAFGYHRPSQYFSSDTGVEDFLQNHPARPLLKFYCAGSLGEFENELRFRRDRRHDKKFPAAIFHPTPEMILNFSYGLDDIADEVEKICSQFGVQLGRFAFSRIDGMCDFQFPEECAHGEGLRRLKDAVLKLPGAEEKGYDFVAHQYLKQDSTP